MPALITADMLYNLVQCPHRVTMDAFGDPAKRDEPNAFVQLLWERGHRFEQEVIEELKVPFLNLRPHAGEEKKRLTNEAMERGEPLIYNGRISADDLLGDPDLLRKEGAGYIAGDIKSGSGEEGPEDNKTPKEHYAVQLSLYTDILERKGKSAGRHGFIWDINGEEVPYDFTALYGKRNPRTLWDDYQAALAQARAIIAKTDRTLPAYAGVCKLCQWYTACIADLEKADDLTLIPELGRAKRDVMQPYVATVREFSEANPAAYLDGKKTIFPGVGLPTLEKFHARAKLLTTKDAKPYLSAPVKLPLADKELFFDIETDPMRDLCYLHGFIERTGGDNSTERFTPFFAEEPTPEAEEKAFAEAWAYVQASQPCMIYYYSKYERTHYRLLREKYPRVCTEADVEAMFDPARAVDLLYDVVRKATEWPTRDHSIKTLAKYLGFKYRDAYPSGAASIEWFHRWVEEGDPAIKQQILEYNEDDCRATRVLLDGIRSLT